MAMATITAATTIATMTTVVVAAWERKRKQ